MKNISLVFIIFLTSKVHAQPNWISINPESSFIQCSMPDLELHVLDTMNIESYSFISSDTVQIMFSVELHDSSFLSYLNSTDMEDSIFYEENDTMANPAILYHGFITNLFDTIYDYSFTDITTNQIDITGREYNFLFNETSDPLVKTRMSFRIYFNGHDVVTLFVKAPVNKQTEFYDLKTQFFDSIVLNE